MEFRGGGGAARARQEDEDDEGLEEKPQRDAGGETKSEYADEEDQIMSRVGRSHAFRKPKFEAPTTPKKPTQQKTGRSSGSGSKKGGRQRPQPKWSNYSSIGGQKSKKQNGKMKTPPQKTRRRHEDNGDDPKKQPLSYAAAVKKGTTTKRSEVFVVSHGLTRDEDDDDEDVELRQKKKKYATEFRGVFADDESVDFLVATSLRDPASRTEDDVDLALDAAVKMCAVPSRRSAHHWLDLSKMTLKEKLPATVFAATADDDRKKNDGADGDDDEKASLRQTADDEEEDSEMSASFEQVPREPLQNVVGLDLSSCVVRRHAMLGSIAVLGPSLTWLDVSNVGLFYLPFEWGALGKLRTLRASGNNVSQWPDAAFGVPVYAAPSDSDDSDDEEEEDNATATTSSKKPAKREPTHWEPSPLGRSVTDVDLSSNVLTQVPENVKLLEKLTTLNVSTNAVSYVDDALFAQVPTLRRVDLQNNNAVQELGSCLTKFLRRLPGNSIDLANCPELRTPPADVAESSADNVVAFFDHHKIADGALQQRRHRAFLAERDTLWLKRIRHLELKARARKAEWDNAFVSGGGSGGDGPRFLGHSASLDEAATPKRSRQVSTAASPLRRGDLFSSAASVATTEDDVDDVDDASTAYDAQVPGYDDSSQGIAALVLRLEREAAEFAEVATREEQRSASGLARATPPKRVASEPRGLAMASAKRASSSPNLGQQPHGTASSSSDNKAQCARARATEAQRDRVEVMKILKRLACDERQAVEVFACFCSPLELLVQEPGRPDRVVKVPETDQLQLMREVKVMIDAVPAPQREIVPAACWPTDVVNALLRCNDEDLMRSPTLAPQQHASSPPNREALMTTQREPLKPRIFHFAGHCVKPTAWWLRGQKRGAGEKGCLVWSSDGSRFADDDEHRLGFSLPPAEDMPSLAQLMAPPPPLAGAAADKKPTTLFQDRLMRLTSGNSPQKQQRNRLEDRSSGGQQRGANHNNNNNNNGKPPASARNSKHRDIAETPRLEEFIKVLELCDGLELCFLNACNSYGLANDILQRLGHTGLCLICWKSAASDKPASTFARYFYEQIGTRPCIDLESAFHHALARWKKRFRYGDPHGADAARKDMRPHGMPCFLRPQDRALPPRPRRTAKSSTTTTTPPRSQRPAAAPAKAHLHV
mmetsp:Transcript_29202/g.89330  ORF Transcript_29202/g.89330 Transcript_29202/m.89330 type:complete len:1164 (-) Transcript_29202:438-3929(-)